MAWVKLLLDFVWGAASSIWRTDKPEGTVVKDAKPATPVDKRTDAELLNELGVRSDNRPEG